ncbi:hypothetical protein ABGB18_13190 [Nonomuraea sp. B12E4]|uniref:hypothetical protein n=1 Tax=Nonomuraea sp. B12E4 TaxID=3153564 RepID=UPI00325C900D
MGRFVPAVGLFFLAPLVAEFLLGDVPITALYALVGLAPLYGAGALLIREVCRRAGWGWPGIVTLALAFGVLEEGICLQSLFNPDFGGAHLHLLDPGYIPALGIGVPYTLFVLTLHMVWSISVPIALTEAAAKQRRTSPWLGRPGLVVTGGIYALGVLLNARQGRAQSDFAASTPQLIGSGVVVVLLVALAVFLGRRRRPARQSSGRTPTAWLLGLASLVITSAFIIAWFVGRNVLPAWGFTTAVLAVHVGGTLLISRWSRRPGWTQLHQLALAAGALFTYAWHGFQTPTFMPATPAVKLAGNIVFAVAALVLVAVTAVRNRGDKPQATLPPTLAH